MKPWYRSKKLWAAVVSGVCAMLAAVISSYIDRPELATVMIASVTSIGAALVVAIGVTDAGKEAAHIRVAALKEKK